MLLLQLNRPLMLLLDILTPYFSHLSNSALSRLTRNVQGLVLLDHFYCSSFVITSVDINTGFQCTTIKRSYGLRKLSR